MSSISFSTNIFSRCIFLDEVVAAAPTVAMFLYYVSQPIAAVPSTRCPTPAAPRLLRSKLGAPHDFTLTASRASMFPSKF